jgi:hypothetical protein
MSRWCPIALITSPDRRPRSKVRLTDFFGKPFVGTTVMSVDDRSATDLRR